MIFQLSDEPKITKIGPELYFYAFITTHFFGFHVSDLSYVTYYYMIALRTAQVFLAVHQKCKT